MSDKGDSRTAPATPGLLNMSSVRNLIAKSPLLGEAAYCHSTRTIHFSYQSENEINLRKNQKGVGQRGQGWGWGGGWDVTLQIIYSEAFLCTFFFYQTVQLYDFCSFFSFSGVLKIVYFVWKYLYIYFNQTGQALLITDPPPTSSTTLSKKEVEKRHLTRDT